MLYICESWFKCPFEDCEHKVKHLHSNQCEYGICTKAEMLGISSKCIPFSKRLTNIRW